MGQGIVWLVVIAGWIALSKGSLSIGGFDKVADVNGVGDNIDIYWKYDAVYGGDKIWLLGRRKDQDPTSSEGMVSTLFISNKTWNHQPNALDTTPMFSSFSSTFKPFSLNGRLLTIAYENYDPDMRLKLYVWNDEEWSEVPFDTSTVESPRGLDRRDIEITVPDQSSNIAYLATSASENGQSAEAIISKLEVKFDASSNPINANLSPVDRKKRTDTNAYVLFTPVVGDQMYVFWNNGRDGYIFNLTNNDTRPLAIDENKWNNGFVFFQLGDKALFFDTRPNPKVYSYDLNGAKFDGDQEMKYPLGNPRILLDQKNEVIYTVDVDEGVYKSKIGV